MIFDNSNITFYNRPPRRSRTTTLVGQIYGYLTVFSYIGVYANEKTSIWLCQCKCGTFLIVRRPALRSGHTKSCGCLNDEVRQRAKTHGQSHHPLYPMWKQMKQRCENPRNDSYARYGGRGIKVCGRWLKFENFLADMGKRPTSKHSIERRNNNKNYEPSNCYWATRAEQNSNTSYNRFLEYRGERLTLTQWANRIGISHSGIQKRLKLGWSVEQILTTPVKTQYRN